MRALPVTTLACLVVPAACGRGGNAGSARPPGHASLVYYETYDPRSLDPALSTDVPTGEMVALAYDGLTQFDPDGKLLPALADRWTVSRGAGGGTGLRYVFHLRAGVRFHDGTRLTPAAVRQSFLRVLAPGTRGGRAWPLYPIAGAEAYAAGRVSDVTGIQLLGDSAVAFDLPEPLAIFPKFLAMPVAAIVPAPLSPQADLGQHPVGTGAWRFVAWQHDDYLVFAKNPDYWGGAPAADTLTVRIIPEPLTRAAEFEAGRLLAAAGHGERGGAGIALQLWRNTSNVELARVAQAVQAQLEPVGIRVELVERDASSQREAARKGETDMVVLDWWADYPDADNFLYPLFYSGSFGPGGNYAFYADAAADSLILRARRTTDDAARTALYREIDERVYRAAPWLYLWFPTDIWAKRPDVVGWDVPGLFAGQRRTGARRAP